MNTLYAFGRYFIEWCCSYLECGYSIRVKKNQDFSLKILAGCCIFGTEALKKSSYSVSMQVNTSLTLICMYRLQLLTVEELKLGETKTQEIIKKN